MILVTGGAGFIGSNFVHQWLAESDQSIINLDKLTYAGNQQNLATLSGNNRYHFVQGDIADEALLKELLRTHQPTAIINFAAESHVDRSILGPRPFVDTNVVGLATLLECARQYWDELPSPARSSFRFLQISTDEVYGSLAPGDPPFEETKTYEPNSPYSASKAAGDHMVRAYHQTYQLPVLTTNCSNNYGPFQFPEKLIPLVIVNALSGKELPIYGDGRQIRDWLYVEDHCTAIFTILSSGTPGEVYNIGGRNEKTNLEVVHTICDLLDKLRPSDPGIPYRSQISYVTDRPGHDRRYAINADKLSRQLGWTPAETFETGIEKTVLWYLDHMSWVENVQSGEYREWLDKNYQQRQV